MRNLKKALSLALALVMLLGMMVVGAGAAVTTSADFSDSEDVAENRVEALDVMTALDVFQGDDGGKLNPKETLTREQAAAIVARMLLGSAADNLKATSTSYSDVATDRWSAGVIEYCTNMDILAGHAGKFDPAGELTNVAFAKMMLCALGYKADAEQFTGPNWAVNVATVARRAGIDVDLAVNSAAMSRQDAAQMAFNTLTAHMVEYTWQGQSGYGATQWIENEITGDYRTSVGATNGTDRRDSYLQFCEMYFKNLKYSTVNGDVFGDTVSQWRLVNGSNTDTITTVPVEPALTYTEYVNARTIYSDLNLVRAVNVTKVEDGQSSTVSITNSSSNGYQKVGGQGAVTKVWTDEYGIPERITVINTYVGDISGVNASAGTVTISPRVSGEPVRTFATEGLAVGDIVLYTQSGANKTIRSAEKVEAETGTLTAFTERKNPNQSNYVNGSATLGTDTYQYAEKISTNDAKNGSLKKTVTVVKDTYGNIIWVNDVDPAAGPYAFVIGVKAHPSRTDVDLATVATQSGSVVDWLVSKGTVDANLVNNLVRYTSSGGVYTLNAASKSTDADHDVSTAKCAIAPTAANTTMTTKGSRYVNVTDAVNGIADSTTVFIVRRGLNSFEAYQGIANVPTMVAVKATNTASILGTDNVVRAVYIDARQDVTFNGSIDDVVYILKQNRVDGDQTNGYYGVYTAVVNGVIDNEFKANLGLSAETLYTYSKVNSTTGVATVSTVGQSTNGTVKVINSSVTLGNKGGFTFNSATRAYVVNDLGQLESYTINNVPTASNDKVWYADVAGTLSLIVIEKGNASSGAGPVDTDGSVNETLKRVTVNTSVTATNDEAMTEAVTKLTNAGYTVTKVNGVSSIDALKDGVSYNFTVAIKRSLTIDAKMADGSEGAVSVDKTSVETTGADTTVTLSLTGLPVKSTVDVEGLIAGVTKSSVAYTNGSVVQADGKATITLAVDVSAVVADVANVKVAVTAATKASIARGTENTSNFVGFTTGVTFSATADSVTVTKDTSKRGSADQLKGMYSGSNGTLGIYSDAACTTASTDTNLDFTKTYYLKVTGDASHADSDVCAITVTVQKSAISKSGNTDANVTDIAADGSTATVASATITAAQLTAKYTGTGTGAAIKMYSDADCTTEVTGAIGASGTYYLVSDGGTTHAASDKFTVTVTVTP